MLKREIVDGVVELMQDSSAAARGLANRWVNYILDDIASRGHLKSLQREERCTLIAGQGVDMNTGRDYDLNPDTDKVSAVFVPNWGDCGILKKKSERFFLKQMAIDGYTYRSRPQIYMIFGLKTLRIHPIPSIDYAPVNPTDLQKMYIWKYKDPAHLTENEEITEWKIKHTPLIISGAYAYGARFDARGDYTTTKQEYEAAIIRLFADQENDLDEAPQVPYNDT